MPARRKPLPASLTQGAFGSGDAAAAGAGRGVLRGPGVLRIGRGLFLASDAEPTYPTLVAAHLTMLPEGMTAVDGVTALRLWGIDVGPERPYRYVTTATHHSVRPEVRVRRTRQTLPPCHRSVLLPLPALVAARNDLDLVSLVVAGDWLIRAGHGTLRDVQSALAAATGRDCRRAHRAAELVRGGSESPRESRLRLLIVLAGLPEPECNVELGDERGFIARVDLYLRAWRVAGEYEGDQHRTDPDTYAKDLRRYERLVTHGVLPVRVAKAHLARPRDIVRRIHEALVSRGYAGPPPVFGPEWCQAFEPWRPLPAT